jgi:asparagine synthase (glutamine-hydrolysing)
MCGIFGIIVRNGRVDPDLLQRATDSLAHRGPDDSGTTIISETVPEPLEIGIGNRRLAIQDLSPLGHQPMWDSETGNWIVFNGEIYNFPEIRQELQNSGIRFCGHSDTEVLLKAYGRWGEDCLSRLRGMFALAIWDKQRHRLFLARDPMGIKPLYYHQFNETFLFASEVRALLETGLVPRRLDPAGLSNYLSFGSAYDPITLIAGVCALRAGHFAIWEHSEFRERKYWDLVAKTPAAHSGDLPDVVHDAVRMQTVSDVPVGVFLSGGIDSSAIAAILAQGGQDVDTFSLVFEESDYSEAEYSRAVSRKFGTRHHEMSISAQTALESLPGALSSMDQPSIDGFNTYLVARETRAAGIKVALSGLGGDEMFAGYQSFRSVPRMEKLLSVWSALPGAARAPLSSAFHVIAPSSDQNRKLHALATSNGHLIHPYFLSRMLFTPRQSDALSPFLDPEIRQRAAASQWECVENTRNFDPVNRVSYLEARCYMLNTLLRDSDVMSMAHGLEVRVPLLDHRLAETLKALPGPDKLGNGVPKPLLVNALKGALPDQIVRRRKRGFILPFEHWLRAELRSEVEQGLRRISEGPLARLVDGMAVSRVWNDFQQGRTSWSRPWSLFVLQRWCELNRVLPWN